MAIIYSYPDNANILLTDLLIGTSTVRIAGKKKNLTKNFTVEALGNFISLNNPTVWGNIVGNLQDQTDLWSALESKQGNITLTTNGVDGPSTFIADVLNIPQYTGGLQSLQQVTDIGNTTTNDIVVTDGAYTTTVALTQFSTFDSIADKYAGLSTIYGLSFQEGIFSATLFNLDSITHDINFYLPVLKAGAAYTLATTDDIPSITPAALTKTDDTNVTLTLGGTPNTALLEATSLTLGWTGTLEDSRITSANTWNAKQNALSGSGIVKSTAGTISYISGTSSQFIKGDGSLDSSVYLTGITLSDVTTALGYTPVTNARTLTINGVGYDLSADRSWTIATNAGTVTSVGMTVPSAFSVTPSSITTSGTFAITGAGIASQYVRGDGTLANFPTSTGGGASVSYYLNGSVSQGTIGGVAYKEINGTPIIGAGTDFTINADGYIAQFITDVGDPNKLLIPAGNWNFETYFSASSGGGSPRFYIELYKYNGATFTLITSNSATPENITGGTAIDLYFTAIAVPPTTLLATDRLAVRFYVIHSGRTITMHTENSHLSQIITTFSTGLNDLNGLTSQTQYFAVGTTGTDFNISSVTDTHTFNLPSASATARGLVTVNGQTFAGVKTFTSAPILSSLTASQLLALDASKNIQSLDTATYPSLTELSYVKGVTSSIQTQLNSKVKFLVKDAVPKTVTNAVTQVISSSYLIPANTLSNNDFIRIVTAGLTRTGTGNVVFRIYINSANSLSGANIIASAATISPSVTFAQITRNLIVSNNIIKNVLVNTASDVQSTTVALTPITINNSVDQYILVALSSPISTDTITQEGLEITN
jgi:hypothetical protein